MITLKIKVERVTEIVFPCSDNVLNEKLKEVGMGEIMPAQASVIEVSEPADLPLRLNFFHNLDEINYLAKRMHSFDRNELSTFIESVKFDKFDMPKDLINATFNLHRYSLIQDVSDMEKVGRHYILSKQGAISQTEAEKMDFASIGKEILSVGKINVTDKGLLVAIDGAEFHEVYDGTTFPEYDYIGNGLLTAEISFNGKTDYVYLPDDDMSISKALVRLDAPNLEACKCDITDISTDIGGTKALLDRILVREGLYAVNKVAFYINDADIDLKKLQALTEYAGNEDSETVCALAKGINNFTFIEDIKDDEDVGRYFVENDSDYNVHSDLEDFIKYDEFGEWLRQGMEGKFVNGGYVSMKNPFTTIDYVLEKYSVSMEGISMGGM
ncbi:MAG: hypothetical protein IKT38_03805 [Clostridia bacterium]|nr:hypothetical protein [Clostridia bacterium]